MLFLRQTVCSTSRAGKERVSADGGVFEAHRPRLFACFVLHLSARRAGGDGNIQAGRSGIGEQAVFRVVYFFKSDIYPRDPDVGVAGWVVGRGIINGGLHYEILKLVSLGILLAWFAFYFYTRSARQAPLASVAVVGVSVFAARGSIGLLHLMGFGIKESIFMLLAYAAAIVQSTSFHCGFSRRTIQCAASIRCCRKVKYGEERASALRVQCFSLPFSPLRASGRSPTFSVSSILGDGHSCRYRRCERFRACRVDCAGASSHNRRRICR